MKRPNTVTTTPARMMLERTTPAMTSSIGYDAGPTAAVEATVAVGVSAVMVAMGRNGGLKGTVDCAKLTAEPVAVVVGASIEPSCMSTTKI